MSRQVVLLSGGLDSLVALALAKLQAPVCLALTFDYGQQARGAEVRAAQRIARHYKVSHRVVKLPWLAGITNTALVNKTVSLPKLNTADLDALQTTKRSAKAVWVPNRNGVFLNIAAAYAERLQADRLVTGFNQEEATTFPDNSLVYLKRATQALAYSTLSHVKVVSPTARLTKFQIVRRGLRRNVPFELFYSCYRAGRKMCGCCESCLRAKRAFRRAGAWAQVSRRFVS